MGRERARHAPAFPGMDLEPFLTCQWPNCSTCHPTSSLLSRTPPAIKNLDFQLKACHARLRNERSSLFRWGERRELGSQNGKAACLPPTLSSPLKSFSWDWLGQSRRGAPCFGASPIPCPGDGRVSASDFNFSPDGCFLANRNIERSGGHRNHRDGEQNYTMMPELLGVIAPSWIIQTLVGFLSRSGREAQGRHKLNRGLDNGCIAQCHCRNKATHPQTPDPH
ncbi:hypothetical protein B0H67DRAFT_559660 [Lasiosphaeris hirsuta]|uniref:Uncharacterized protein n=1 Tax=Lasiosphaeris hirsuta TaxID=260670 RepID=A0AA40B8V1_9PEZI|nr:hypothetical protein B0H67DRAFT_559660 [Lasiosphaeris hirsuta]